MLLSFTIILAGRSKGCLPGRDDYTKGPLPVSRESMPGQSGAEEVTKAFTGEFVAKDSDRQIVTAPVLIPDEPDKAGDVVSAENIEKVGTDFMENYRNVDIMHTLENVGVPVESWITRTDLTFEEAGREVPEGSWMMSVKVNDEEVWQAVKAGELNGFSIFGRAERGEEVPA